MENYLKFVTPDEEKLSMLQSHELRNSRLFVIFLHITFIPLLIFTVLNYASGKYLAGHIDFVGFLGFIVLLTFYKFTGLYKQSVIAFVLNCQFVIGLQHLIAPTGLGSNLLWLPLIIMTSSYLLGKSTGIKLGAINGILMIIAEALPKYVEIPTEHFLQSEILQYNISIIAVTTLSAFLVTDRILFEEKTYLRKIEKQRQDLFDEKETTAALLNIIAHDIANPLTLIQGRLKYINRQFSQPEDFDRNKVHGHLNQLIKRSEEIAHNIELIRQYRAYESGKLEIKLQSVNLTTVVDQSLEVFADKLKKKNLIVVKKYNENNQFHIKADAVSLQMSVLNNLISNAIKFSHPDDTILIEIVRQQEHVVFKIKDHGIGIPDDLKPFIFSGHRPTSRKGTIGEEGTGFGMPILKMFLDKYDATIELQQPLDGGTLFTIIFHKAKVHDVPKIVSSGS